MQSPSFVKRQKELRRLEKQREKEAKRAERKLAKQEGAVEPTAPLDAAIEPSQT